jgi:hypothetical protein
MLQKIKMHLKNWWKRNIVDDCPPELESDEFSEKHRK